MSAFVLIHGGFCRGWIWAETVAALEADGHRAEVVDLPSSGTVAADLGDLQADIATVRRTLDRTRHGDSARRALLWRHGAHRVRRPPVSAAQRLPGGIGCSGGNRRRAGRWRATGLDSHPRRRDRQYHRRPGDGPAGAVRRHRPGRFAAEVHPATY